MTVRTFIRKVKNLWTNLQFIWSLDPKDSFEDYLINLNLKTTSSLRDQWYKEMGRVIKEFSEKVDLEIGADVDLRKRGGPRCRVIMSGRYKDRGFVDVFDIEEESFVGLVDFLRKMERDYQPQEFIFDAESSAQRFWDGLPDRPRYRRASSGPERLP